jgi:ribosomal peptide maturation radical SAM protein 1
MNDQRVMLINMPWAMPERPSIELGILQSVLSRAGIQTQVRSFNLAFMDYLASVDADLPEQEERFFPVTDYLLVATYYYIVGLGDWTFAVAPFRDASKKSDEQYFDYIRARTGLEEMIAKAVRVRELVPAFLERCVEDVLAAAPSVIGFTTVFNQNVPSLVLAKLLKLRDPSLHIVFGGGNCDGPMGEALHRAFPWVDTVVRGEGEHVLPELVRDVFAGRAIRPQPGLCYREGERRVVIAQEGGAEVQMDELPLPDYDEYFERLAESSLKPEILRNLTIPFESARGCWWGAKAHCTFCGLNGTAMPFRSKSPARVVSELMTLARKHERLDFQAVDNIIAMPYFQDVLPQLRDAGYDFKLTYETKSNLKKEQLRVMREAGVLKIQPGVESFSTPILKLMKKGVTGLQNIRLLKWCAELGIVPYWNLLYGFPGEPPEEYDRMAEVMKSLTHLRPPQAVSVIYLERFSPYHQRPREYGLEITGPKPFYRFIYPCDEATLNDLAYVFDYSYDDGREPETYVAAVLERIEAWQADFENGSELSYRRGPGFLLINDRRPGLGRCNYSLDGIEAKVYLSCDGGATPLAVWKALQGAGETDISLEDIAEFLEELTEMKLMYEEDGLYLSLAVAESLQPQSTVIEAANELVASPAFVKLSRPAVEI